MLLVAVIALSGSTFAWFAQNTVVTAEKITVTAETAKNLSISATGTSGWNTSMELEAVPEGTKYWPVSAANGTTHIGTSSAVTSISSQNAVDFYIIDSVNKVASADASTATTGVAAYLADKTQGGFSTTTGSFYTDDIYLRYDYTADQTAAISASAIVIFDADLADKDISKALHIGFATANNKWYNGEVSAVTQNSTTNKYEATIKFDDFITLTANVPQLVKAYVWYEGEDTDCFTNASLNPAAPSVAFSFAIK